MHLPCWPLVLALAIGSAFVRILDEFLQRYVLSYSLERTPAPGWHRLDVRVKQRGASVKARSGYQVVSK